MPAATETLAAPRCILCGASAEEHNIGQDLDTGLIHCGACSVDFAVADLEANLAAWQRLLPWLKAHPELAAAKPEPATA